MKLISSMIVVLTLFLMFSALDARILPDYLNEVHSLIRMPRETTFETIWKWLFINVTLHDDEVGRTPSGRAPPSPKPAPGTRPLVAAY